MVDCAVLEQVLRLDVASRRELVRALQESIDRDEVTLDEFKRKIAECRARRSS